MGLTEGRRNTITSDAELESRLATIATHFSPRWLAAGGTHPLRRLWPRRDALATAELYTLGEALMRLSPIDPAWVKHTVEQARSGSTNNARGALFELIGIAMLAAPPQMPRPAPPGHPGYDAVVPHTGCLRNLSYKCFSLSRHEDTFRVAADRAKDVLLRDAKTVRLPSVAIHIEATTYPDSGMWRDLTATFPGMLHEMATAGESRRQLTDWNVVVTPVPPNGAELHTGYLSYTFLATAPHHPNEVLNLFSTVDQACANLARHGIGRAPTELNQLVLRVPITVDLSDVQDWLNVYFKDHPSKPVHSAILYQPVPIRDSEGRTSQIQHSVVEVSGTRGKQWFSDHPHAVLVQSIPVGLAASESASLVKLSSGTAVIMKGHYFHQVGEHYYRGHMAGSVKNPAPGIRLHLVMDPTVPGDDSLLIVGNFPEQEDLLII